MLRTSSELDFEVKFLKSSAGAEITDNSFFYGIDNRKPIITFSGKIRIDSPDSRKKSLDEIIRNFWVACSLFDKKAEIEAELNPVE